MRRCLGRCDCVGATEIEAFEKWPRRVYSKGLGCVESPCRMIKSRLRKVTELDFRKKQSGIRKWTAVKVAPSWPIVTSVASPLSIKAQNWVANVSLVQEDGAYKVTVEATVVAPRTSGFSGKESDRELLVTARCRQAQSNQMSVIRSIMNPMGTKKSMIQRAAYLWEPFQEIPGHVSCFGRSCPRYCSSRKRGCESA